MRVPTGKIPAQPLTFMWERHFEILRRLVAGDRQCDIAHSLGMTDARLSIIVNSPLFQARLLELRSRANSNATDIQKRITSLSVDSMTLLENAIRAKRGTPEYEDMKPIERAKLAQDNLDRAGHGAIQKSVALTGVITSDDLEELKRRRMKIINPDQQAVPG